jgi:hypothetical protein
MREPMARDNATWDESDEGLANEAFSEPGGHKQA